eukprot:Nitzschia sp. Nitz4//scaffold78_size91513//8506//10438//NITZ4_004914-RA/size91513-augustus-gene-0.29-mRNA-1//-1//CDS//3329558085//6082//frame0
MRILRLYQLVLVEAILVEWSLSFSPLLQPLRAFHSVASTTGSCCSSNVPCYANNGPLSARTSSEFAVIEDESDGAAPTDFSQSSFIRISQNELHNDKTGNATRQRTPAGVGSLRPEYAALPPGTLVQVQVDDATQARKAFKKRRRTESPLYLPCRIVGIDQLNMVRWNLIFLLQNFGYPYYDGIQITIPELARRYRSNLQSSLSRQTSLMGFDSTDDMLVSLFPPSIQQAYGVRLIQTPGCSPRIAAPMTKTKALLRASKTPRLQFERQSNSTALKHTGVIISQNSSSFIQLTTELRVSQIDDLDSGKVYNGSIHPAVVYRYDGDDSAATPLLTLALDPRVPRKQMHIQPAKPFDPKRFVEKPENDFDQLRVGEGPYKAKVLKLLGKHATVDMGVAFLGKSGKYERLDGILEFRDAYRMELVRKPKDFTTQAGCTPITISELPRPESSLSINETEKPKWLPRHLRGVTREPPELMPYFFRYWVNEGEEIDVYIRSISKQSRRFTVTTNPTAHGRKARDMDKEREVRRKRKRLTNQLGGSLETLEEMKGKSCVGIVRAKSKRGDWVYVQPSLDGLPVGIGTLQQGVPMDLAKGDRVKVQINGIDSERGQLALDVLEKIEI